MAKAVLDFFVKGVLVGVDIIKKMTGNSEVPEDARVEEEIGIEQSSGGSALYSTERIPIQNDGGGANQHYVRSLLGNELAARMKTSIKDAGLIESCYFVPETANGWAVLREMRRRRVHMAIVVDKFGGTEGLVSLEEIVQEVVGEIYDEDDASMCESFVLVVRYCTRISLYLTLLTVGRS